MAPPPVVRTHADDGDPQATEVGRAERERREETVVVYRPSEARHHVVGDGGQWPNWAAVKSDANYRERVEGAGHTFRDIINR